MARERARRKSARGPAMPARAAAPVRRAPPWAWVLAPLLAALTAVVLHARTLTSPFFADDWLFLDVVRSRSLFAALAARDPIGNFFRPLGRAAWFWLLSHVSGESPLAFHVANLALFVACVLLLWALARRVAGARAAGIAAALFALTHAADVPVRWASGSQDLLAVTLALAATLALVRGRRALAALLFLLAPLAKEIVALAALPAMLLARRPREPWSVTLRRAWPAGVSMVAWAAIAALAATRRQGAGVLSFSPLAPLGALAGALRTFFGLEWGSHEGPHSAWGPVAFAALALGAAAVACAGPTGADGPANAQRPARRDVFAGALAWLVAGALPVAFVAPIWSAYFYLYAMAGASLFAGALLASAPLPVAMLLVVVLGGAARRAGDLSEFATQSALFGRESHVNDFYLERGMNVIARGVSDLRRLHPRPPKRSTFFFTGVPSFAAFQVGDGPLVRGVYRDSSLRSYYLTDLNRERMKRGPTWFVFYSPDSGHFQDQSDDPDLFMRVAMGNLLNGREDAAREAVQIGVARGNVSRTGWYLAAFMALDAGDRAAASRCFKEAGCREAANGDAVLRAADQRTEAGDTTAAIRILTLGVADFVLDPRIHARIADLQLTGWRGGSGTSLESYAQRVLAPEDGVAWRRWAYMLYFQSRIAQAHEALEKYYRLSPDQANADPSARDLRALLPRLMPGGDLLQRGLLREASR